MVGCWMSNALLRLTREVSSLTVFGIGMVNVDGWDGFGFGLYDCSWWKFWVVIVEMVLGLGCVMVVGGVDCGSFREMRGGVE